MRLRALLAAALLGACAHVPNPGDATFARVHMGMTEGEVRSITGAPHEDRPFPMLRSHSWGWYYWDAFGYYSLYSVTFGPDGRVASTFLQRLNDGGNHQ